MLRNSNLVSGSPITEHAVREMKQVNHVNEHRDVWAALKNTICLLCLLYKFGK